MSAYLFRQLPPFLRPGMPPVERPGRYGADSGPCISSSVGFRARVWARRRRRENRPARRRRAHHHRASRATPANASSHIARCRRAKILSRPCRRRACPRSPAGSPHRHTSSCRRRSPPLYSTWRCLMVGSSTTASSVARSRLTSSRRRAASSKFRSAAASRIRTSRSASTVSKLWPIAIASSAMPPSPISTSTWSRS